MSHSSVREYALLYVGGKVVQSGIRGGNAIVTPTMIEQAINAVVAARPGPPGEQGEPGESGVIIMQAAAAAAGAAAVGSTRQGVTRTSGSFTLATSTTAMTEVDAAMRLTLPAQVGDVILVGVGALLQAGASGEAALDTAVVVGGSIVRTIGAGSRGVGHIYTSTLIGGGGSLTLVVASGDLSGGNVTLSLAYINSSLGSTGLLYATTTYGLHYWAVNLGQ